MRLSTGHIFLSTRLCAPTTSADSLPRTNSMPPSAPGLRGDVVILEASCDKIGRKFNELLKVALC